MIPATWKKVLVDLWANKTRTLLVALSVAVGVLAVGVVASSFIIIKQDMAADYFSINPHTAQIFCQDFDPALVAALVDTPEVEAIEGRYNLWIKVTGRDGRDYPINLNSIPALDQVAVDQLVFEQGSPTLGDHEIYLERQGAAGLGLQPGDRADFTLPDGQVRTLTVAGTVHDVHANPFKFIGKTSGYVNPATMAWLGGSAQYNFVTFITAGSHTDAAHIRRIAEHVAAGIEEGGYAVYNIHISNPGQHPAQSIIDTVLALMGALGVLAVFLSAFLVTNTISALMSQQIRQIGVMKAIGATMGQMMAMYLALVLAFGLLALLMAVPLAGLLAYGLTQTLEGMLNADPAPFAIPAASLALQVAIGLGVPLLAALLPVTGGARLTVREAISNYGLSATTRPGGFDRLIEKVRGLPRPLLLSLRNTFRRKGRLALTLATLVLGGAIFIAVFSVREAMYTEFERSYGYYQSDVNVDLPHPYLLAELEPVVESVSGVVAVEGWQSLTANVLQADGEIGDLVFLYAPPADTRLVTPILTAGRWLQPGDENSIVVDNHFANARPEVALGDRIQVRIAETDYAFQVVGFFKVAGDPGIPLTYVNNDYLEKVTGTVGQVNSLRIVADRHDAARQAEVLSGLQDRFAAENMGVSLQTGSEIIAQKQEQVNILIYLLLFMAVLIATVGGLGLTGTMSMNVLERTREIGVMRSIGAENGAIFGMVVVEGLLIGLLSWALSLLVAVPITQLLDTRVGVPLMTVPLSFVFSAQGSLAWLLVVLLLATVASLLPARNAVRLTVRDVLAYE